MRLITVGSEKLSAKYFNIWNKLVGPEIEITFLESNKLNGGYTHEYYSKFINHQFNLAIKEIGIRLYTQSFRISWMIFWLQSHISIQKIQKLVHYKDIRRYSNHQKASILILNTKTFTNNQIPNSKIYRKVSERFLYFDQYTL